MRLSRQQIINEIKRMAARQGGRPPGKRAFAAETGIREADWSGRFWARWSDAVEEAGLTPNRMATAYDELVLLAHLARIIEDLGKWPTTAEIRLYLRTHPDCPSDSVFRRLGRQGAQAALLLKHQGSLNLSDRALRICEEKATTVRPDPALVKAASPTAGSVYLLKSGRYYKVGRSNAPGRRVYEVNLQMPEPARLLHEITTDDPAGIEAYWHRRFAGRRRNGEWFLLTAADVAAFRSRRTM